MQRIPYRLADEAAAKITKKIRREFRHNRLALFDEMNVVQVKKHVHKLYKDIFKIIKKEFLAVVDPICAEIYNETLSMGFEGEVREMGIDWLERFLDKYNPVTKYVFRNEMERKESRLFEALVSAMEERYESYATAENLLVRQIKQGVIDLEDEIEEETYKDVGVEKVQWVAEGDSKTCGVCRALDGEIFDIDDAPDKQHHNCRCYLIPVKE
jgi:SPP1 gp7 family putative phage head morphogenesis protein